MGSEMCIRDRGKGVDASLSEALYYARKAIVQGGVIAEPLEKEILERMNQ